MEFLRENILKIVTMIVIFVVVIIISTVACGNGSGIRKAKSYQDMENNLEVATKKYLNSNSNLLPKADGKVTKINLDTLISSKYIKEQTAIEDENVSCSGYTEVLNKNDEYVYVPYIKCGKYYETKTIAKYIIDKEEIISSGDGLYKFSDIYVYRGENPNNYIKLGEKVYRILEINKNNELKLISTVRYTDSSPWDDRYNVEKDRSDGINDYTKSRIKDTLENLLNDTEFFSEQEKKKIIAHDVCVGKRDADNLNITTEPECSTMYPNQKIGLLLAAEYSRVSTDSNCNKLDSLSCQNYNYLNSIAQSYTTMTASTKDTSSVFRITSGVLKQVRASAEFYPYPVIYIDKLSIYSKGDGTLENPYIIR